MGDTGKAGLQRAIALFERGKLEEAAAACREIAAADPRQFDARHLAGVIAGQMGDLATAVTWFERALAVNPASVDVRVNLGLALVRLERNAEAVDCLGRALERQPARAEALFNRAVALERLDRNEEALADAQRCLGVQTIAEALHLTGLLELKCERPERAVAALVRAVELAPRAAAAHADLAVALNKLRRPAEALAAAERALELQPSRADWLVHRGIALDGLERTAEALACADRAIELAPQTGAPYLLRGVLLRKLEQPEAALATYDCALRVDPGNVQVLHDKANLILECLDRPAEALALYDRALELRPDYVEVLSNRGNTLRALHRHQEALESFARAQALRPEFAPAHWNDALCRLLLGDFEAGWRGYEWRWRMPDLVGTERVFDRPRWTGPEPLAGKTVLLYAEQGLGDAMLFSRYAPLVAARGARVVLEVHPPLKSLLSRVDGVSEVVAAGETLPAFDLHCPLMSVPLAVVTRLETIPATVPYLSNDPERVARWRERLAGGSGPLIGLVWSGRPTHSNDHRRSIPFAEFAELLVPGPRYVALQPELRPADLTAVASRPDVELFGSALADPAETAAAIECLDLVITVDTFVAHLTGALGKPVWILLPADPDWRWLLDRDTSPWYPSATLFRQAIGEERSTSLRAVRERLASYLA